MRGEDETKEDVMIQDVGFISGGGGVLQGVLSIHETLESPI